MARCEAQGAGFIGSLNITADQLEGTTGNGAFMRDLRQLGIVTKWEWKYGNVQQRFYSLLFQLVLSVSLFLHVLAYFSCFYQFFIYFLWFGGLPQCQKRHWKYIIVHAY